MGGCIDNLASISTVSKCYALFPSCTKVHLWRAHFHLASPRSWISKWHLEQPCSLTRSHFYDKAFICSWLTGDSHGAWWKDEEDKTYAKGKCTLSTWQLTHLPTLSFDTTKSLSHPHFCIKVCDHPYVYRKTSKPHVVLTSSIVLVVSFTSWLLAAA